MISFETFLSSVGSNGHGGKCHRQNGEITGGFGLYVGLIDNNKNIKYLQPCLVATTVNGF